MVRVESVRNDQDRITRRADGSVWREYYDTELAENGHLLHYSGADSIQLQREGQENLVLVVGRPEIADLLVTYDKIAVGAVSLVREHGRPIDLPSLEKLRLEQ